MADNFNPSILGGQGLNASTRERWRQVGTGMGGERNIRQPTLIYLITLQKLQNDRYPQDSVRVERTPVTMLVLRRFQEAIVSYSMYSPFVKHTKLMVNL